MSTEKVKKSSTKKVKEITIADPVITPTESKLTLTDIIEDDSKYDELIKVSFPNGKYTEVRRYFRPSLIEKMLEDYANFLITFEQIGNLITEKESDLFLKLHIILYFSQLVDGMPEDIHDKVNVFRKMADNDLVKKTLFSFDENEISKVYETIVEKFEAIQKLMKHNVEMKQQLKEKVSEMNLENKDIIMETMFGEDGEFA